MARTPMPGQLMSVGRHRLHMRTVGDSPITVVFDHGCGGSSLIWSLVAIEKAIHDVAVDISHLSVRGKLVVAQHSTHDIYIDEPEVIVRAVKQVVAAVKK